MSVADNEQWQWTVNSGQLIAGSGQGQRQWTVDSKQWARNGKWTVNSGHWTMGNPLDAKRSFRPPIFADFSSPQFYRYKQGLYSYPFPSIWRGGWSSAATVKAVVFGQIRKELEKLANFPRWFLTLFCGLKNVYMSWFILWKSYILSVVFVTIV